MTDIETLETELSDEKAKLSVMRRVVWGDPTGGMNEYADQQNLVTRLTVELNRLKSQGRTT